MDKRIAFLFPGQGSQYVGMGKDLYKNYKLAREYFDKANDILDIDLKTLCFEGSKEELTETKNTQPAIYTVSVIINELLRKNNIKPSLVAGHSLGEYTALYAAGVYDFQSGLKLVRKRGELMSAAGKQNTNGTMAAIIALKIGKIKEICKQVEGICEIANINSPLQIVISGEVTAVKEVMKKAKEAGAKKVVQLDVSSAFHSPLMKPAREKLREYIKKIDFEDPNLPIIANSTADFVSNKDQIINALDKQLTNTVRWVESMELLAENDINIVLEVGPGKVLKSLMRRIDRSITAYNIENKVSLEKAIENSKDWR